MKERPSPSYGRILSTKTEFIACPGCGRTKFNLPTVLNEVRSATSHLKGLNIAVMGCFPALLQGWIEGFYLKL